MAPTIIIEIQGGNLEAVYSNTDLTVFVVDRDNAQAGDKTVIGPFTPTLVTPDLTRALPNDPEITPALLATAPSTPYF